MKIRSSLLAVVPVVSAALPAVLSPSCQPAFPTDVPGRSLTINITAGNTGTDAHRIPISFQTPTIFTVHVEADDQSGVLDPTFNGYVRFSIEPGSVIGVTGPNTTGRNVQLINGVADNVEVSVVGAYGDARIIVEDLGYVPADPAGVPLPDGGLRPPQCANGIDDNHNGLVDYPVDPGCYAGNDDTEDGGTYAGAASGTVYFLYPRIADVQGVDNNGAGTPFPNEQVQIDTLWNGTTGATRYGVVVVGIAATGFFVTDLSDPRGYSSVYGYTYSSPAQMNVCDRLITFGGTSSNFYGFTEINYPTWSLEEWDPVARPCLVPEPAKLSVAAINGSTATLATLEAALVRVPSGEPGSSLRLPSKLGPGLIPYTKNADGSFNSITLPIQPDATSCDYQGTGKIDFSDPAESACETACTNDIECSEYSQYASNSQVELIVTDSNGTTKIAGDGSASAGFNPVSQRGDTLEAFTGNLLYFSGGEQFTIQARCADDIVVKGGTILPSSPPWPVPDGGTQEPAACVVNRTIADQPTTN